MLVSRGAGGTATVTVTNNDGAAHDLVARAGGANSFATGNIAGGGGQHSFSVATVGSTDVFCSVHPSMAPITLIVQ